MRAPHHDETPRHVRHDVLEPVRQHVPDLARVVRQRAAQHVVDGERRERARPLAHRVAREPQRLARRAAGVAVRRRPDEHARGRLAGVVGHGLGDDLRAHRVADEHDDGARGAVGQVEHVAAHVLRDDGRVLLDRHVARRAGRRAEAGQVDRVHRDPGERARPQERAPHRVERARRRPDAVHEHDDDVGRVRPGHVHDGGEVADRAARLRGAR